MALNVAPQKVLILLCRLGSGNFYVNVFLAWEGVTRMKLHSEATGAINLVTAVEQDWVRVGAETYRTALILMPDRVIEAWTPRAVGALDESDFAMLASLRIPVVLLGTGRKLRFPEGRLLKPIAEAGVGLEVMDLAAACRTYNILATEGRQVAAALVFDADS